jgi:Patatin-like phospholipase
VKSKPPPPLPPAPIGELAAEVFRRDVFPEEIAYITERRRAAGSAHGAVPDPTPVVTAHNGLVGVALSGGGVRSATFNLGLLQALHRRGILPHVDYLSTVSGGGFVGASLTALVRAPGSAFPFAYTEREGEPAPLTYLRNNCDYLAPGGYFDYARMIGLLFRGIMLNVLMLFPFVVAMSAGVSVAYRHRLVMLDQHPGASPWSWVGVTWLTPWAMAVGFGWTLLFPLISLGYRVRLFHKRRGGDRAAGRGIYWRDWYERSFGACLTLTLVAIAVDLQPVLLHYFHRAYDRGGLTFTGVAGAVSIVGSLAAGRAASILKEHGRIVGLVVAGVVGPLLPFSAYLFLAHALAYGELEKVLGFAPDLPLLGLAVVLFAVFYALVDVNASSMHGFYRDRLSRAYLMTGAGGGELRPEDEVSLADICQAGSGAPYHLFNATLNLEGAQTGLPRGRRSDYFMFSKHFVGSSHTGYCRTEHVEATFPFMHLATAMAVSGAAAAPNMGPLTSRALVFLMAALNIRLGYWLPNPRRIAAVVARHGERARDVLARRLFRPGPMCLFREMLSLLDAEGEGVNLSDGGHLENTGLYELLRRRCRYIVAGDAETDPGLKFHGLADVMRYARIDLGVELDIPLDDLVLDAGGHCRRHCAFGRIHYPARGDEPPEVGYLLYVKASVTGDEDGIVSEYRSRSPDYPHEPTSDQFFDDRQFEAYRALGFHALDGLFEPLDAGVETHPITYPELVDRFRNLELALSPHADAADDGSPLAAQWAQVEERIAAPALAWYALELYPELGREAGDARPADPAEGLRRVLPVVNLQLRLMESIVVALDLTQQRNRDHAGHRGWMNLFRRWAAAPSFRRGYAALISAYSTGFQHFCEHALGLTAHLVWAPAAPRGAAGRLVLWIGDPGGDGFPVGETTLGDGAPSSAGIALRAGFDSADLRHSARHQLDVYLRGERIPGHDGGAATNPGHDGSAAIKPPGHDEGAAPKPPGQTAAVG